MPAEGEIDKPVNCNTNYACKDGGKKKLRMGLMPREITKV